MNTKEDIKKAGLKNLPMKEIAKLIRKDLKEHFPNCKFSVRSGYSGVYGRIDVTVKELTPKYVNDDGEIDPYTEELIEWVLGTYNYDESDIMTDYFDMNFMSFIHTDEFVVI